MTGKAGQVISYPERALLGFATLGGGVVGYLIGHKSEPDYDDPIFEKELETNVAFWAQMESDFRREYLLTVVKNLRWLRQKNLSAKEQTSTMSTHTELTPFRKEFMSHHPEINEQAWHDPVILNALAGARPLEQPR